MSIHVIGRLGASGQTGRSPGSTSVGRVRFHSMLDRALIRKEPEFVRTGCKRKGVDAPVDEFLAVDEKWRAVKHQLDVQNGEMNKVSKSIGALIGQGASSHASMATGVTSRRLPKGQ